MDNNKSLMYASIIVSFLAVAATVYILLTNMKYLSNDGQIVNDSKPEISNESKTMTNEELNKYLTDFLECSTDNFNSVSEISDYNKFWFGVRVYLLSVEGKSQKGTDEYKIPLIKIQEIVEKYFGVKDFYYDVSNETVDIKYDDAKKVYKSGFEFGLYRHGPTYKIEVGNVVNDGNDKVVTLKLIYDEENAPAEEYTVTMNENYNIIKFNKKNTESKTMTDEELNKYLTDFLECYTSADEFNSVSEISNFNKFWFGVRVYLLSDEGKTQNDSDDFIIPLIKVQEAVEKYFGVKDFYYDISNEQIDIKYDNTEKVYKSKLQFGLYRHGPTYKIEVGNVVNDGNDKVVTLKLIYDEENAPAEEYSVTLNENYNVIKFNEKGK